MKKLLLILDGLKGEIDFCREQKLMTEGIIDSVGLTELISLLEEHYGIEILLEDITSENFDSVKSIYKLLCKKGIAEKEDEVDE